ncbi:MAG: DUF6262 family protein [Mycobacteriales bacterium]
MMADNTQALRDAQQRHHAALIQRAREAVRKLDSCGEEVTFASVARTSLVSRAFLYKNADLAAQIQLHRDRPRAPKSTIPASQRISNESKEARIMALLDDNRALRADNQRLKAQVGVLLGSLRERKIPGSDRGMETSQAAAPGKRQREQGGAPL